MILKLQVITDDDELMVSAHHFHDSNQSMMISDGVLYHGETWELMARRWGKLEKDFRQRDNRYDISKIPDIYDCIKYDLQHNQAALK